MKKNNESAGLSGSGFSPQPAARERDIRKSVSVIIPAFNEEKSLARVVEEVQAVLREKDWRYEIIVIDDGSTDRTREVARGLPVILVEHKKQRGYGASIKTGILKAEFDYILITDADGTYPASVIPALLEATNEFDMVVGARVGKNVAIPPVRRFPKWLLNKLSNYLAGMKIPDLNSGLRVFKKAVALKFFNIIPSGFSFTTTLTLAFLSNDYQVEYIPIDYYRREGKSKFRPFQDTFNLLTLIIRTSLYFNPLKIFVPAGGFFFLAGLVLLAIRLIRGSGGLVTTVVLLMAALQFLALGLLADLVDKRSQR